MKKLHYIALAGMFAITIAHAEPAAYVGLSYTFGGEIGISAKVLSENEEDNVVAAVGASYYPFSQNKFGLDVGAGYAFDNAAALIGWDFLQHRIQGSIGWADTDDNSSPAPAPAPAPVHAPL